MDMREKIARALFDAHLPNMHATSRGLTEVEIHDYWPRLADAVLEAMREPTPEMEKAGFDATLRFDCAPMQMTTPRSVFIYTAMITAALTKEPTP